MFLGGPTTCVCDDCVVETPVVPKSRIRREHNATLHNRIANDPDVKPTLGYNEGPTDFTDLFDHPEAYVLLSDGASAASIFEWSAPAVWQGHSMMLPEVRGKAAVLAGKAMCRFMFEELGAELLWGMTPIEHRPALIFNRLLGFEPTGKTGVDAGGLNVAFYIFRREKWLSR